MNEQRNFIQQYQERFSHGIGETRMLRIHRYERSRYQPMDRGLMGPEAYRSVLPQAAARATEGTANTEHESLPSPLLAQDDYISTRITSKQAYPHKRTLAPILLKRRATISNPSSSREVDIVRHIAYTPGYLLSSFPGNLPSSPLNSSLDPFFLLPRHVTSREKSLLHLCKNHAH